MKTNIQLLIAILAISFSACKGPRGLPGADGLDGKDGDSLLGTVFTINGDFTPENDYSIYFAFPDDFTVYKSDIIVVSIFWENYEKEDGTFTEIWRMLPQTRILQQTDKTDLLQYNFDYSVEDVVIMLEGDIDYSTLLPGDLENQHFRIAVIPADFAAEVNINNIDELIKSSLLKLY